MLDIAAHERFARPGIRRPAAGAGGRRRARPVRRRRLDPGAALLRRRSDRARTGVAGRVEGAALLDSADVRTVVRPVRHVRLQAVRHARPEHQHDRRGAGLELVHQPDRHDHRSPPTQLARGPIVGAATRPVELGGDQGKDLGRASRLHRAGWQRRDLVPRVRSAALTRKARPAPWRSRPRSSGRSATTRSNRS